MQAPVPHGVNYMQLYPPIVFGGLGSLILCAYIIYAHAQDGSGSGSESGSGLGSVPWLERGCILNLFHVVFICHFHQKYKNKYFHGIYVDAKYSKAMIWLTCAIVVVQIGGAQIFGVE